MMLSVFLLKLKNNTEFDLTDDTILQNIGLFVNKKGNSN